MLSPTMREIVNIKERLNEIERRQSEFAEMLHQQSASDIDYIAMESGIDLDQDESE